MQLSQSMIMQTLLTELNVFFKDGGEGHRHGLIGHMKDIAISLFKEGDGDGRCLDCEV